MAENTGTTPKQLTSYLVTFLLIVGVSLWTGSKLGNASVPDTSKYTHIIDSLNNRISEEQGIKQKALLTADSLGKELKTLAAEKARLDSKLATAQKARTDNRTATASLSDADLVSRFNEEVTKVKRGRP